MWPPQVWQLYKNRLINSATPHNPFMGPAVVMDIHQLSQAKSAGPWEREAKGSQALMGPPSSPLAESIVPREGQSHRFLNNARTLSQGALCKQGRKGSHGGRQRIKTPLWTPALASHLCLLRSSCELARGGCLRFKCPGPSPNLLILNL